MASLRRTALFEEHRKLGAAFTDFGGWEMPLKYSSELAEHRAVRTGAGLFDLSHMGEISVSGPEAGAFLDYALVSRLSGIAVGRAKYSLICVPDGGIMDDLISYRLSEERYLVVPNAANADAVARALTERAAAFDAVVEDKSGETSLIAVQGPSAEAILLLMVSAAGRGAVHELKYYAACELDVSGVKVLLARTGYTGEDGFELFVSNAQAAALWRNLLEAGSAFDLRPAGLACRDSLRLEAGMPLYGQELTLRTDPYAAGLGGVVALDKPGDFVGRAALEACREDYDRGVGRMLVGLRGQGRRAARARYPVLSGGVSIGEVTSGALGPSLGYPVAFAYVERANSTPGDSVFVDVRGQVEPFTVVKPPFYHRPAK